MNAERSSLFPDADDALNRLSDYVPLGAYDEVLKPLEQALMRESLFEGVPHETVVELYVGACERIAELESGLAGRITNEPGTSWEWREDGTLHVRRTDAA